MKALVYEGPKQLSWKEIDYLYPKENEVMIKVKSVGICGSDLHGYLGLTGRRTAPMVMGHEFSGQIIKVGRNVDSCQVSDRVTAQPVIFCGECKFCKQGQTNVCTNKKFFGVMDYNGAMAEYLCIPEKLIYKLPDNVSYTEGALIEPLAVAYGAIKKVTSLKDKTILIIGAGTIGMMTLLLAKKYKPSQIIVADISNRRLEKAKKFGADKTVNPSQIDIKKYVKELTEGNGTDIVFEAVGIQKTVDQCIKCVASKGECVWIGLSSKEVTIDMQNVVGREIKINGSYIYTHQQFGETIEILSENKLDIESIVSEKVPMKYGEYAFKRLIENPDDLLKIVLFNEY